MLYSELLCLFFGLGDSMLRIVFIVRSLGLFNLIRVAFYVVNYSEYAEVHQHYFCMKAAGI